jgi:hypothetical protein
MSDTPRTDKETGKSMGSDSIVYASFARQLERELTEAREQRDRLAEAIRKHRDELELTSGDSVDVILWNTIAAVEGGEP